MEVYLIEFIQCGRKHPQPFTKEQAEEAARLFRMIGMECVVRLFRLPEMEVGEVLVKA